MKRNLILMVPAVLFFITVSMSPGLQDKPQPEMKKTHIREVTIKDGEKQILDTLISGNNMKVFTMEGNSDFDWESSGLSPEIDSLLKEIEIESGDRKEKRIIIRRAGDDNEWPALPGSRGTQVFRFRKNQGGNVINLSDPGIISFKKKKLSGGREKITVIRKETKENTEGTLNYQFDNKGDLEKMNAPRVVRELDVRKKDLPVPEGKKEEK